VLLLASLGFDPGTTLLSSAGLVIVFEGSRFALTLRGEPLLRSVPPQPVTRILRDARGSLAYYLATATQTGLQPYVAASISSRVVSVAVPARTLANSARSLSTAVINVVWVPVAARLSELKDGAEQLRFWRRNHLVLSAVQVAGIAVLLGLAPFVVPRWLPAKSDEILRLLPLYCVEQAMYVAAIPSFVLLQATGRFGALGAATLVSAIGTVAGTVALVPHFGAIGFVSSSAGSAALILAPTVLALEWRYWHTKGVSPASTLVPRFALALLVASVAIGYTYHRWLSVAAELAILVFVVWYALRARRSVADHAHG
jgi:O-antigen/teichoic acid export membrane protein